MTSSQHNSDERDLLDFADAVAAGQNPQPRTDEERTYLHVQHAMQGESAAIPSTTKQSTWEDVMSTLALTPEAPVSNRTRKQQELSSPPPRTPRARRLQWTPLASVAAAALVIIASFGVWFTSGNESTPPPMAPQMAGIPSGGEIAQVAATPDATAVTDESGSYSIPIIQHVNEQPMDGPVIWLTTTGDVMYDDGTEVTSIATNATNIQPQTTNVIKVITDEPEQDWTGKDGQEYEGYTVTYHNLITGETLVDDQSFSSYLGGPNTFGPLTVLTIADAPREWSIVNFETMKSKSIAEITGGQYRSSESITVAVSDDLSTIAVGTSQYESEASAILMKMSGMPGEVAVIPADLSGVSWVSVPEGMPAVGNILLSPDGSEIAFIASDRSENGATMTVSIVDVATNEELTRTDQISSNLSINFQWIDDGNAFVIISSGGVISFPIDGSDPTVLLESDGTIQQMPKIVGSDMIYLQVSSVALDMTTPVPETTQLVILDPATGETINVDGIPWIHGGSYPVTISMGLSPILVSDGETTAQLVHPITGAEVPDVVADIYDPLRDPEFEPVAGEALPLVQPVVTAFDTSISAVKLVDGTLAIVDTTPDGFDISNVEIPAEIADSQLVFSADGRYLIAGNSWSLEEGDSIWVLNLSDENPEWVQLDPNTRIHFTEVDEN